VIAVLVPTFGRADRLARVAANIAENTETEHRVVFAVEAEDVASIAAAAELDVDVVVNEGRPNYSGAITTAYRETPAEYVFAGADDLNFQPGWDTAALALMDGWVQVVGTNDLLNPYVTAGLHATHCLVDRLATAYFNSMSPMVSSPASCTNAAAIHSLACRSTLHHIRSSS
jgi:hypothetical protein